jgi:hypothetical protein
MNLNDFIRPSRANKRRSVLAVLSAASRLISFYSSFHYIKTALRCNFILMRFSFVFNLHKPLYSAAVFSPALSTTIFHFKTEIYPHSQYFCAEILAKQSAIWFNSAFFRRTGD